MRFKIITEIYTNCKKISHKIQKVVDCFFIATYITLDKKIYKIRLDYIFLNLE